ncbi:hypothetical protein A2344_01485 [Candidatus Peregrinibacteria bacterium RIFOXYB12_FULL_41_12]|nr:MAG: hypothetical protein A2344_01485 [Candidatus Peregrinibacteria bacterium RIFOXYB12_FULL_41_12]OGJ53132.1 MAG: hypothetical protein A2448_00155 [Candidatus Peregrinibacteria bacterium RIFOXYC2_FULL_41_22]OGJ54449.1 MAG: hypothetical protein A2336_03085 [Candidatus Peregrinibacteria bacterium RIFOXYB2_FULL_41_88]
MEALHKMIGFVPHSRSKSPRSFVLALIVICLLVVAVIFGSASNFFGFVSPLKSSLNINLASWPSYSEFAYDYDDDKTSPLVGFTFTAGSSQDVHVDSITFTGYIRNDDLTDYEQGVTSYAGYPYYPVSLNEVLGTIWLEDYSTGSIIPGIGSSSYDGEIVISELDLNIPKGETKTIIVYGNMEGLSSYGLDTLYVALDIANYSDVVASAGSIIRRNVVPTLTTHNSIPQSGHPYAYVEISCVGYYGYYGDCYPYDYETEQNPYGLPSFDPEKINQ